MATTNLDRTEDPEDQLWSMLVNPHISLVSSRTYSLHHHKNSRPDTEGAIDENIPRNIWIPSCDVVDL